MASNHITIGDISPRIQYTGDGAVTAFTYPFPIFTNADIEVYEDATLKTITTDYTVTGAGVSTGGTVTFVTAPASGVVVTLLRNLTIERTTDFQESGEFRSQVINDELDKQVAMSQQVNDRVDRSLRLASTDPDATLTLPLKATRLRKFLGFDSNGDVAAKDLASIGAIVLSDTTAQSPTATGTSGISDQISRSDHAHPEQTTASASTTVSGTVELATQTETDAGTDAARAITPSTLSNYSGLAAAKNLLINASAQINQRGYISTTATTAANEYTLDRWRVVASGENLTFTTTENIATLTAPTNGLEQVIDGDDIQSGTYAISWTGTATCTVDAVAKTNGQTFTLTGGTNASIVFKGGTVISPMVVLGSSAPTTFAQAGGGLRGAELALCQRFFYRIGSGGFASYFAPGTLRTTTDARFILNYPTTMRVAPTLSINAVGDWRVQHAATTSIPSALGSAGDVLTDCVMIYATVPATTAGQGALLYAAAATEFIQLDAEI